MAKLRETTPADATATTASTPANEPAAATPEPSGSTPADPSPPQDDTTTPAAPTAQPTSTAPVVTEPPQTPATPLASAVDDDMAYLAAVIKKQAQAPSLAAAEQAARALDPALARQVVAAGRAGQVRAVRQLLQLE